MKTECPFCNQEYEIEEEYIGQVVKCEQCEKEFTINANNRIIDLGKSKNSKNLKNKNSSKLKMLSAISFAFIVGALIGYFFKTVEPPRQEIKSSEIQTTKNDFSLKKTNNKSSRLPATKRPCSDVLYKLASEGNMSAQYILGMKYYRGNGVTEDKSIASMWFKKAIEQAKVDYDNKIDHFIYYYYYVKLGSKFDINSTFSSIQELVQKGSITQLYNLGLCYATGMGTPVNQEKALNCFFQVASKGYYPFLPQSMSRWKIGMVGRICPIEKKMTTGNGVHRIYITTITVSQVIDSKNALITYKVFGGYYYSSEKQIWLKGVSTKNWIDGKVIAKSTDSENKILFPGLFCITSTKTYQTVSGSNTVFVLEPVKP